MFRVPFDSRGVRARATAGEGRRCSGTVADDPGVYDGVRSIVVNAARDGG